MTHWHAYCSSCLWLVVTKSSEMNVQMCLSSFYYAPQIFSFNFYTQLLVFRLLQLTPATYTLAPLHFPDQYKVPVSAVDLLIDDNPKKKNQRNVKLCCQIFWLGSSSDKRQSEDFFLNIKSCPWAAHISSAEPASDVTKIFLTRDCSTTAPHCTDCQLSVEWLNFGIGSGIGSVDTQYLDASKNIITDSCFEGSLITKQGFAGETWRQLAWFKILDPVLVRILKM